MPSLPRNLILNGLCLLAAGLGLAVAAPSAKAQDTALFNNLFGQSTGGSTNTYDREYIKEWEINPPKGFATISKSNIEPTKAAIQRYGDIVSKGGWGTIPEAALQAGANQPEVKLLRTRLAISGELKEEDNGSGFYDYGLEKAVRRYQATNGLTPTGIADKRTIAALNVPAAARLAQLKSNIGRLTELANSVGPKYVVVNIPAAQVEAIDNGQIFARYAGVVGKIDRPTPLLKSAITDLNFNPVWTVPPTVETEDLIPRGREMQKKGQSVLEKFHIDAYDGAGKKMAPEKVDWSKVSAGTYRFSQQPGKENPLGFLKINFDSAHSVYMHDSPSENVFGRNFRAASSGCIRVQNIEHLAGWILKDQDGWDPERVAQMKKSGERLDLRLKKAMPLHFVYLTAWATEDGTIQFRRDLYQKDGIGAVASNY